MGQSVGSSRLGLRLRLLAGVAVAGLVAPLASPAVADEPNKWQPWVEAGGMVGTDHSFGAVDFFIPVWQDQGSLLFGDLRGQFSSDDVQEGNFGLGFRTRIDTDWIIGGYAYLDIQNSPDDNLFYQGS